MGGWDAYCAICGVVAMEIYWLGEEEEQEEDSYDPSTVCREDLKWLSYDFRTFTYTKGDDECTHMSALAPETLDLQILYETFKICSLTSQGSYLDLEYDGVEACMEQYWVVMRGTEDYVTSLSSSPRLLDWYRSVVNLLLERVERFPAIVDGYKSLNDPFCKLQPELLLYIMSYMTMTEATRWREASRRVASLAVVNSFWKSKIHADMPWLYDFSEPKDKPAALVDWEALYKAPYKAVFTDGIHK
ncbi:hypothetical protein EDB81DRAFT_751425 [Dactylonectria macrodidyma]|uniref:F-box domain-containing protein n=1 Tax=Dactylonectria macrodidyma TaxID=307937 RepID=A0A9P9JR74_9HYPO|nr:hypothetical protein EDB81DRAFT_751425 [Dactylonectria macrodidyma]